jgi:MFS family permease
MSRIRRLGQLTVVDISPLKENSGFRWLFGGMLLAQAGRQLTVVAVPIQIYLITDSTLAVGMLGLVQLVPLLAVSLVGGALADAMDRKRLLIIAEVALAFLGIGLWWNSIIDDPKLWPIYVLSGLNAGLSSIHNPARQALVPGLVGRRLFPAALALNQTQTNVAKTAVPAVGGLMIAFSGLAFTYAAQIVLFVAAAAMLLKIPPVEVEGGGRPFSASSIREGLGFLKSRQIIQAALLMDFSAMVFGMPTAIFPAFGEDVLGGDEFTVGLLFAAPGAGAMVAAVTSGWVSKVRRQGRAVALAVTAWGLGIAIFGLSNSLWLSLTMLAFAGAADVVSAIFRQSMIQLATPDSLRGRLSSIHGAASGGGPRLGDLEAGVVAEVSSVRFSVISGGVACAACAFAISKWSPLFYNYEFEADEVESERTGAVP